MRIRTIISAFLPVGIFPMDGQLVTQQCFQSLPEFAIDDPPMTMMELGKDAYSMPMVKFVGLRPIPSTADRGRELLKRDDSLLSFCFRCRLNVNFGIYFRSNLSRFISGDDLISLRRFWQRRRLWIQKRQGWQVQRRRRVPLLLQQEWQSWW